eukprot:m.436806 g.436806  ORF g.436806 m.436806 type:complete len:148 (+) comp56778_c1_seq3:919-1362(+)
MIHGSRHSASCVRPLQQGEDASTAVVLRQSLQGGRLLQAQTLDCDFLRSLTWQQIRDHRVVAFEEFSNSITLRNCWEEIFFVVTRGCCDPTAVHFERSWKLFAILPWLTDLSRVSARKQCPLSRLGDRFRNPRPRALKASDSQRSIV